MKRFRITCDGEVLSEHDDLIDACTSLETLYRKKRLYMARLEVIEPEPAKYDRGERVSKRRK